MGKLLMRHDIFQKDDALPAMSINELWALHENIAAILVEKIEGEKVKLQGRLDELNRRFGVPPVLGKPLAKARARRPYPKVNPKFQNPQRPSETWAGRGKKPHWVSELLNAGGSIDDLRIARTLEVAS
jgi:DNA-binding protein H-NS